MNGITVFIYMVSAYLGNGKGEKNQNENVWIQRNSNSQPFASQILTGTLDRGDELYLKSHRILQFKYF